jgi:LacI family transcriptional regulator
LRGVEIEGIDKQKVVICDRSSKVVEYTQITNDHIEGAYQATVHLIQQGYKNVGHIKGLANDKIADDIHAGYSKAITQFSLIPSCYQLKDVSPEESYLAMKSLVESNDLDAVLTVSDEAALGVYRYCYDQNIRVPDEMAVVGYSNAKFSQYLTPSLSTVDQRSRQIGIKAIEMLSMSQRHSPNNNIQTFSSSLIIRESSNRTNYESSHKS